MRHLSVVALATLLAGCAVGPDYERPVSQTPAGWRYSGAAPAPMPAAEDFANLAWWKLFGDPVLDQLVAEALVNNRDLRIAAARVDEAAGVLGTTRSRFFPQVGAGLGAGRGRGAASNYQIADQYSATLGVAWEIDLFGRIRRSTEAAQAQLLASEEARTGVALTLAGAVANAYIGLRDLDRQLEISRQTLKTREEALKIFELRYAGGVISDMQLAQVRSEVEVARIAVPIAERDVALRENAISILLGKAPGPVPRGKTLNEMLIPLPPAGLPSELLERRPDIREAEQRLISFNAQIGVAKAAYFPTISLTGLLGSVSPAYSGLFTGPYKVWSYAADAALPVFTAGSIAGQVQSAEARQVQALEGYRKSIEESFREVEDALVSTARNREVVAALVRQVKDLEVYARSANLRYDNGYSSYLEVLDAERSLFQAQLGESQARAQSLTAVTTLYKALGGGWQATGSTTDAAMAKPPAPK